MRNVNPLLVEWSPSHVRLLDPATGESRTGTTLAECSPESGRDVVVAVSRRSAFVRSTYVPAGSAASVTGVLGFQMAQELPLAPQEIVFGYRLGENVAGKGRRAAVGAVRAESLTRIESEARACGLRIRAVLPVAFGSWLAARNAGLRDVAVVEREDGILSVDLVKDGELLYSRTVPTDDPEDEIERTFSIAEVAPMSVLALGDPTLPAERHDPRGALAQLADLVTIDRLLFTLEPPSQKLARQARQERWKIQRAALAAILAVVLTSYAIGARLRVKNIATKPTGLGGETARTLRDKRNAEDRIAAATKRNRVLDVAFRPPQSVGDVVRALASAASGEVWLTGLNVSRGVPLTVTGLAMQGADVSRCLAQASRDKRFEEMRVLSTNKGLVGKTPVVQFAITGRAVGSMPYDRPLKNVKKKKEKKAGATVRRNDR